MEASDRDQRSPSRAEAQVILTKCGTRTIALLLTLLCVSAFLLAKRVSAQEDNTEPGVPCGQTRLVLVRFLDARPIPRVKVMLSAASPAMGGPGLYLTDRPSTTEGVQNLEDLVVSPLPTSDIECNPVITGTLTALTDPHGLARFDRLGEGTWVVQFEGEIEHEGEIAAIVPASVQGRFPYGRTREGGGFLERVDALNEHGGFLERVDALNEHGGPNPEPVQPGTGTTTSRYVFQVSIEHGGWLPGLDLVTEDDVLPMPLAAVTPVMTITPEALHAGQTPGADGNGNAESPSSDIGGESAFDPADVELVTGPGQSLLEPDERPNAMPLFNIWWVIVLGLTLGGLLAVAWAKRQASAVKASTRAHKGKKGSN